MQTPSEWIDSELKNLAKNNLLTPFKTVESEIGSHIKVDGKKVLNFCSNNYLGLAADKRLRNAAIKAIKKYGVGPGAVRTISGTNSLHIKLEMALAKFKKAEDAILFQSGFTANLAVIPALVRENDIIFSDELNHASIIDACRLSKAQVVRYAHSSPQDLEKKLKVTKIKGKRLIVTDGVFSMDGDIAPLSKIQKLAKKYGTMLVVDDAHGEGVLGTNGRGIVDYFKLHGKIDVEVGTLSKAFGVIGGFVTGKKHVIEWLRRRGRPFLFSSAMTVPDTAAAIKAVEILHTSDSLVKRLWKNTDYFKSKMSQLGFDTGSSSTPIVPLMLMDEKLTKEFSNELFKKNIFATPIVFPTVPKGKARIRVMISAAHTSKDLDTCLKAFEAVGRQMKIIT